MYLEAGSRYELGTEWQYDSGKQPMQYSTSNVRTLLRCGVDHTCPDGLVCGDGCRPPWE